MEHTGIYSSVVVYARSSFLCVHAINVKRLRCMHEIFYALLSQTPPVFYSLFIFPSTISVYHLFIDKWGTIMSLGATVFELSLAISVCVYVSKILQ